MTSRHPHAYSEDIFLHTDDIRCAQDHYLLRTMSMRSSLLSSSLSGKNLYPIICLVIAAISSVACFLPFLIPALQHPDDTDIIDAVGSEDYELAAYLSIAIAVPMMIEILTEAFNGTKEESGQFHLFVRVSLLASVTIPSIPIVIPSIFMNQTASTYLSINAVKRISAASCMLAFISRSINIHDKSAVKESKSDIFMLHMSSNRQGQLAVSVYFTYAMAELIWLYGSYYEYSLTDDTYSYRVAAMALYATAYFQVLLLIYFRKSWIDQSLSSILKTGRTGLEGSTDLGPLIPDLGPVIPDLGPLIPMNLQPSHSFTSFLSINSSNIKCSNIYLSVLVLYPIGTMLITAVLTGTNYMDTSSKDITAHLYFEMFLTLLVSTPL